MSESQIILRIEFENENKAKEVNTLFEKPSNEEAKNVYQSLKPMIKLLEYQSLDSVFIEEIEFSTRLNNNILYLYFYGFDSDLNIVASGLGRFIDAEFRNLGGIYEFTYSFDYVANFVQKFDGENFRDIYSEEQHPDLDEKLANMDSLEDRFEAVIDFYLADSTSDPT